MRAGIVESTISHRSAPSGLSQEVIAMHETVDQSFHVMPERPEERRAEFVDAMSRAATGVTVVTSDGIAGRFGQTVSAMCSVSADPPTLLVCINRKSPICDAIQT